MPQFPQGAPRGAPVHVCGEGPCVLVVRDSVGGYVGWCPQRCCSEGNRGLGLVLFCACRRVWQCGAHNEAVTDGPGLRVGGVFRLVC